MTSYPPTTSPQSTTTNSFTAPLTRTTLQKDFSAAFANLQSAYSANGFAPKPIETRITSHTNYAMKPELSASTPSMSQAPGKNYELAFGNLSSSYGLVGQVPMVPRRTEKKSKSTRPSFVTRMFSKNTK